MHVDYVYLIGVGHVVEELDSNQTGLFNPSQEH